MDARRGPSIARVGARKRLTFRYCDAFETFATFRPGSRASVGHTARVLLRPSRRLVARVEGKKVLMPKVRNPSLHPSLRRSISSAAEVTMLAGTFAAIWISVAWVLIAAITGKAKGGGRSLLMAIETANSVEVGNANRACIIAASGGNRSPTHRLDADHGKNYRLSDLLQHQAPAASAFAGNCNRSFPIAVGLASLANEIHNDFYS
jgi:hypothetical protein